MSEDAPSTPPFDKTQLQAQTRARLAAQLRLLMLRKEVSVRGLAKSTRLARNTIMAALKAKPSTSPQSIEKLFKALEPAAGQLEQLLKPRLSVEDYEIALAYHDATTEVRNFIARILRTREFKTIELTPDIQVLAVNIQHLSEREQRAIRMLVSAYTDTPDDSTAQP